MHLWIMVAVAVGLLVSWWLLSFYRSRCDVVPALTATEVERADYVDHYCAPLRGPVSVARLAQAAVQRGQEVRRTPSGLVFVDHAPGLRFTVGYELAPNQRTLVFSTAVSYEGARGRMYFAAIRPFHRLLAPVVPIATARRARSLIT